MHCQKKPQKTLHYKMKSLQVLNDLTNSVSLCLKQGKIAEGKKSMIWSPHSQIRQFFFKCPSVYNCIKAGIWMNVYIAILYLTITGKVSLGYIISSALDSVRCSRDDLTITDSYLLLINCPNHGLWNFNSA